MNKWLVSGRLTKDPELRHTSSGNAVATFTLASDRRYSGEEKGTDYIPCVAWKKAAEIIAQYMRKGSYMTVIGRGQFRKYTNKKGEEVKVIENIVDEFEFGGSGDYSSEDYPVVDDGDLPF